MRHGSWLFVGVWELLTAVMSALAFLMMGLGGRGALVPAFLFAALAGSFAWSGWRTWRSVRRTSDDDPEVWAVPAPVDDEITIRKTAAPLLIPLLLFSALGWGGVSLCVASMLGLIHGEGSVIVGLLISGLFVLFGHAVLKEHAVTVRLDLRHRRWETRRGVWPFRSLEHGDLTEASRVAVARELRSDEGSEYEVLVARLEWRNRLARTPGAGRAA